MYETFTKAHIKLYRFYTAPILTKNRQKVITDLNGITIKSVFL